MEWNEIEEQKDEHMPYVHIWLKFGQIKAIYPVDKTYAKLSEEELKDEDHDKWVEVPDDYLRTKLEDVMSQSQDDNEDNDYPILAIERKQQLSEVKSELFKKQRDEALSAVLEEYEAKYLLSIIVDFLGEQNNVWSRAVTLMFL